VMKTNPEKRGGYSAGWVRETPGEEGRVYETKIWGVQGEKILIQRHISLNREGERGSLRASKLKKGNHYQKAFLLRRRSERRGKTRNFRYLAGVARRGRKQWKGAQVEREGESIPPLGGGGFTLLFSNLSF